MPDDLSVQMLIDARGRGVEVEIIAPGRHIGVRVQRGFQHVCGTYLHVDSYFKVLPHGDIYLDGKIQPVPWPPAINMRSVA